MTGNDLATAFTPFHHLSFHFPISINHLAKLVRVIELIAGKKIIPERLIIAKGIVFTREFGKSSFLLPVDARTRGKKQEETSTRFVK